MMISSYKYFEPIMISEDSIYTLVIENGHEYRNLVRDLCLQSQFNVGEFVLSSNNEILDFTKNCEILTDMFKVDINDRRILTKLQKQIVEEYAGSDDYYKTVLMLNEFGTKIVNHSEYSLSFNADMSLSDVVRALGIRIAEDVERSLLEQIVDYCTLCKRLLNKRLFLTVGFKDLMSEEEYEEFKKMIEYNKIPLLMLERHTHDTLDDHSAMTIIDKDLCVL